MITNLTKAVAGKLSFAHLASLGRAKPAAAKPAAADDNGDNDEDEGKGKPGAATASDDNDEDEGKGKPGAATASDDNDEDEKAKAARTAGYAEGYEAQRQRCAAIFASPAAAQNIALAAELAFNSDMDAEAVTRALTKAPAPVAASRAARNASIGPGFSAGPADTARATAKQIDDSWDVAMRRASGRR
jgi:hypothetical protein